MILYNSNKLVPGLITQHLSILLLACDLLSDRSLVGEGGNFPDPVFLLVQWGKDHLTSAKAIKKHLSLTTIHTTSFPAQARGPGVLGSWGSGILGSWGPGILRSWGSGILGSWDPGVLGFWGPGVLGSWGPGNYSALSSIIASNVH